MQIIMSDNDIAIPSHSIEKILRSLFLQINQARHRAGIIFSQNNVKARREEIKIDSKEKGGSTFTIFLPLNH